MAPRPLDALAENKPLSREFGARQLPPEPEDHRADYERALAMLGHHVEPTVTLEASAYCELVLDQWRWQHGFYLSNAAYSGTAARIASTLDPNRPV